MASLLTNLSKIRNFDDLYKLPRSIKHNCKISKSIKLLLLNAPCNGFGDLIFVKKIADYLRKTFKIHVTIATTEPEKLLILGESKQYLKKLASTGSPTKKVKPCRVFHKLRLFDFGTSKHTDVDKYDLFFVAPLSFDYNPKISDVKPLITQATKFNTFFFSEYNDSLKKDFDFHTGIGKGRDGILLTTPKIESDAKINKLVDRSRYGPFAFVYIADIDRAKPCVSGFLKLISEKYNHHNRFQIIVPQFLYNTLATQSFVSSTLSKYWGDITVLGSDNKSVKFNGHGKGSLTIRSNVLPVKNDVMMGLIRSSVSDILLTGDQSITDALSCCHKKNIFYQIAPWKADFGKELAKAMPNKYLASTKTSCGDLSAINYKSSYSAFVKKNNFFKNTHDRLQSIICMATADRNKQSDVHKFIDVVNDSRTLAQVKQKLGPPKLLHKRSRKPSRKSRKSIRKSRKSSRKRSGKPLKASRKRSRVIKRSKQRKSKHRYSMSGGSHQPSDVKDMFDALPEHIKKGSKIEAAELHKKTKNINVKLDLPALKQIVQQFKKEVGSLLKIKHPSELENVDQKFKNIGNICSKFIDKQFGLSEHAKMQQLVSKKYSWGETFTPGRNGPYYPLAYARNSNRERIPPSELFRDNDECSICAGSLDPVDDANPTVSLPCGHSFHAQCIDQWNSQPGAQHHAAARERGVPNMYKCPLCGDSDTGFYEMIHDPEYSRLPRVSAASRRAWVRDRDAGLQRARLNPHAAEFNPIGNQGLRDIPPFRPALPWRRDQPQQPWYAELVRFWVNNQNLIMYIFGMLMFMISMGTAYQYRGALGNQLEQRGIAGSARQLMATLVAYSMALFVGLVGIGLFVICMQNYEPDAFEEIGENPCIALLFGCFHMAGAIVEGIVDN